MKLHRIKAVMLRHLYPLQRDFDLLSDMIYWPMVDTLLWGITSQWLADASGQRSILVSIGLKMLKLKNPLSSKDFHVLSFIPAEFPMVSQAFRNF